MSTWQLQEAKSRLSELLKKAVSEGPQHITLRGEPAAVVLSEEEYQRLQRPRPRFLALMQSSPLVDAELEFEREQTSTRDVELT